LMLLGLTLPAPARAQFDDEGKEGKKGDAKWDQKDPFGIQAERKAWDAYLKSLGPGPVYRVEVLYRNRGDGRLYYLRTLVSATKPGGGYGMFGLGVDEQGRPLPPPNPGYVRLERAEAKVETVVDQLPPPPLAEKTRLLGASLDKEDVKAGQLS